MRQVPDIKKIFDDLDSYRDYCRYEGKVYNEAHLYKDGNPNWEDYKKFQNYLRSKKRSPNIRKYKK